MDRIAYIPVQHDDDYYTHDMPLFVGRFPYYRNEPRMVQGKAYVSEERYYTSLVSEIIPLQRREGTRHYVHLKPYVLVLQSHLKGSSRRQERRLRRKQDLQDTRPQALFTPALVPAGDRRPRPEALRQFTPGRASAHDPEHAFHYQAMIDGSTTR